MSRQSKAYQEVDLSFLGPVFVEELWHFPWMQATCIMVLMGGCDCCTAVSCCAVCMPDQCVEHTLYLSFMLLVFFFT